MTAELCFIKLSDDLSSGAVQHTCRNEGIVSFELKVAKAEHRIVELRKLLPYLFLSGRTFHGFADDIFALINVRKSEACGIYHQFSTGICVNFKIERETSVFSLL